MVSTMWLGPLYTEVILNDIPDDANIDDTFQLHRLHLTWAKSAKKVSVLYWCLFGFISISVLALYAD